MSKSILIIFFFLSRFLHAEVTPYYCLYHISDEKKFIYFVVPKTGYSSLLSMIKQNNISVTPQIHWPIDTDQYKDYFKFAFVRNPWDRVVSAYENVVLTQRIRSFKDLGPVGFEEFVDYIERQDLNYCDVHIKLQKSLIPNEIDFIGRFENLTEDLKLLMNILQLENQEILHYNKSEHVHYSHYYNERTRKIIEEKYREDIETFGYKFEDEDLSRGEDIARSEIGQI